ncbi:MAG: glycerate kinase [Clostridia bacterium]|nr:glycerate kinase [Clostridia bacterium]
MKIIIAPDSYKGSLSAVEVSQAIENGIRKVERSADIHKIPMADGGEGTVEAMITATGGKVIEKTVKGPLGEPVSSYFGILQDGTTAVIEMSAASGLPLVPKNNRNPMFTTTYGTGELIKFAVELGCKKLIIGIGGSATNDGGMGMAQALGVKFFDKDGLELGFGGGELLKLDAIDYSNLNVDLNSVNIEVACDVDNPLCGPHGASHVYGPQKGATQEMIQKLDQGLYNYASLIKKHLDKDILDVPGSGAAGGLGGGLVAFLGAKLKSGVDIVIETTGLKEKVKDSDLVFTGEGSTDYQTLFGKAPSGVAKIAKEYGVPVVCLSGGIGENAQKLYDVGVTSLFSIVNRPMSLKESMDNSSKLIEKSVESIYRLFYFSKINC